MIDYKPKGERPPLLRFLALPMTITCLSFYLLPFLMFSAVDVILWNEGVPRLRVSEQYQMVRDVLIDPMPELLVAVIALNLARCAWFAWSWRSIAIASFSLLHLAAIAAVPVVAHLCRIAVRQ